MKDKQGINYIECPSCHLKIKGYSVSDVEQLQKELKEGQIYSLEKQNQTECDICKKKINSYISISANRWCKNCFIDLKFNNFKGK